MVLYQPNGKPYLYIVNHLDLLFGSKFDDDYIKRKKKEKRIVENPSEQKQNLAFLFKLEIKATKELEDALISNLFW